MKVIIACDGLPDGDGMEVRMTLPGVPRVGEMVGFGCEGWEQMTVVIRQVIWDEGRDEVWLAGTFNAEYSEVELVKEAVPA